MDSLFGVPWFNPELFSVIATRLILNLIVVIALASVYRRYSKKKETLFTFIAFNLPIFFIVYLMSLTQISVGIGFGLFAIFTVLRYRTETVSLKDMSYLFLFISVAVFNALVTPAISLIELLFFNFILLATAIVLESVIIKEEKKKEVAINYDNIENLKPENMSLLLSDLKARTGFDVAGVKIKNIDLANGLAKIQVSIDEPNSAKS